MTPFTLFEYILAVVLGLGLGVIIVLLVFSMCMDWDSYEARQRQKCREAK